MLKATLPRQARLCGQLLPLGIIVQPSFRAAQHPLSRVLGSRPGTSALILPFRSHTRQYSSATATAAQVSNEDASPQPGPLTRFADLASLGVQEKLVSAITKGMGYESMTDVQSLTINPALAGKDIVAQAKTGTGKTLAFLLPVLQRMIADDPTLAHRNQHRASSQDIRAIILSPTRELAEQIGTEARKLVRGTGVIVQTAVGGTMKSSMLRRARREGCHLLVATPGRLNDLLSDPESGIDAPNLSALVLDEADRMLDVGFERELGEILRLLPDRARQPRQTLLYSATIPKDVVRLARNYVDNRNFEFVQTVKPDETPTHEKVPQFIVPVRGYENLFPTLLELFAREAHSQQGNPQQLPLKSIVFLPTTAMVQLAAATFAALARRDRRLPPIYCIHSKLTQAKRTFASEDFRRARSAILFSSDVTARGMDFPDVSHVVQIGLPPDREQYIHRIGRTGRANKTGQGWLLMADREVPLARERLPGLPITRYTELESADHDMSSDTPAPPKAVSQVLEATARVPEELVNDTYLSFLGGASKGLNPQVLVDLLNDWIRHGWGRDEPPALSRHDVHRRGLSRIRGIRIAKPEEVYRRGDAIQDRSARSYDDLGRRRGRRGFQSRDTFERMEESRPRHRSVERASF